MGIVRFALRFPAHVLRGCGPDPVSWRRRHPLDADGHFPGNPHPGGDGDLAIHRSHHAGNGTARHHLQPIFHQRQRQRHQEHGSADPQWSVDPEDLLPARRESRPRYRANRVRDEFDSRADAARDRAADRRAVQCVERSRAAAQPQFGQPERAAALRFRYLPRSPGTGAGSRRHAADAGRRQVSADHGRYRPGQAAVPGLDAARHRECGQYPEPDAAVGNREDRKHPIYGANQRDAGDDRRSQQDARQVRQRRHHPAEGRGAGTRRIAGAAEHRARGRPPLGPAQHHQEWQCLHAGGRQRREAGPAGDPRRRAGRHARSTSCSTSRYS